MASCRRKAKSARHGDGGLFAAHASGGQQREKELYEESLKKIAALKRQQSINNSATHHDLSRNTTNLSSTARGSKSDKIPTLSAERYRQLCGPKVARIDPSVSQDIVSSRHDIDRRREYAQHLASTVGPWSQASSSPSKNKMLMTASPQGGKGGVLQDFGEVLYSKSAFRWK